MSDLEDFQAICSQVEALIRECSVDYSNEETLGTVFGRRADDSFKLRRAESLLTDALQRFPLHPYLLERRGDVRCLMINEEGTALAVDGADSDYSLAISLAPHDLSLRFERAMLFYTHSDDMAAVAEDFGDISRRLELQLCRAVAGRVKALHESGGSETARAELARWRAIFPGDSELDEAAQWIK